jgi:transposase InsO family protein
MPWKVSDVMSQRSEFIGRLFSGERMTDLCGEYGITRQAGYKLKERYLRYGAEAFADRSRRPLSSPYQTPEAVVDVLVRWRERHPSWGPKKLKSEIPKKEPGIKLPAASTIGEILSRASLVKPRKHKRRATPSQSLLRKSTSPNELWSADFKGEFRLGNRRYCYPLTITDHFSRYSVGIEGLESTAEEGVRPACESVFERYGLPEAIRVDNGAPFASTGLLGLTRLSVWWMRLGIAVERIEPGHPEQNGRHERFHLTLKQETTRPAKHNILQQQEYFDEFRNHYNESRPHEALDMRYPSQIYQPSTRLYRAQLSPLEYPLHDFSRLVHDSGTIRLSGKGKIYISRALKGERVGLRQIDERWLVSFMTLDLGYIHASENRFQPL